LGAITAGALGLVLLGAQLVLPRLAASRISARLSRHGTVEGVQVSAWPALKLLWAGADSVVIRAGDLSLSLSEAADMLSDSGGAGRVRASAQTVQLGPLRLTDVRVSGDPREMSASATAAAADVAAALPPGMQVELLDSEHGTVRVRVSGGLFGLSASMDAVAQPSDGGLLVRPEGFLMQAFTLRLFSDPRVRLQAVGASADPAVAGYRLSVSATVA
jgi:hypothetical protein